ncbi:MAG: S24 family peptidase, partial [Janthinobacterium lividum]
MEQEAERLAARFVGVNRAAFARDFNIKGGQAMVYQHISGRRPISLDAALAYAKGFECGLEEISPRLADEAAQATSQTRIPHLSQSVAKLKHTADVEIPQYDAGGSMGSGLVLRDQPGVIHSWNVSKEWIKNNVPNNTGVDNLCIVTGFGPSMRPLFNPGDPLLVDRGVTKADTDAIYFFRVGDEGFIKHLQRIPGVGLVAISENKLYRDWTITPEMDFEVFARVIKVWCGTD